MEVFFYRRLTRINAVREKGVSPEKGGSSGKRTDPFSFPASAVLKLIRGGPISTEGELDARELAFHGREFGHTGGRGLTIEFGVVSVDCQSEITCLGEGCA